MNACRPLLGTYVEIRIEHPDATMALAALEAGFAAIAEVERLMSVFDAASEISQLNRLAHLGNVPLSPWTHQVLELALDIHTRSDGLFDCGIAPRLASLGMLPPEVRSSDASSLRNLRLTADGRACASQPTYLDLGGIAKGFAVDRAAEALQNAGAQAGRINAGGDIRVFGETEEAIFLRDPAHPEQLRFAGYLRDGACATSASYYSRRQHACRNVSALIDPRNGQALDSQGSYSVIAEHCATADALTKVLALSGNPDHPCFPHYSAHPIIIEPSRVSP